MGSSFEINIQHASIVAQFIEKTVNCEPTTVNGYNYFLKNDMRNI